MTIASEGKHGSLEEDVGASGGNGGDGGGDGEAGGGNEGDGEAGGGNEGDGEAAPQQLLPMPMALDSKYEHNDWDP